MASMPGTFLATVVLMVLTMALGWGERSSLTMRQSAGARSSMYTGLPVTSCIASFFRNGLLTFFIRRPPSIVSMREMPECPAAGPRSRNSGRGLISSSVGYSFSRKRARAFMMKPGLQKPHCSAP